MLIITFFDDQNLMEQCHVDSNINNNK